VFAAMPFQEAEPIAMKIERAICRPVLLEAMAFQMENFPL